MPTQAERSAATKEKLLEATVELLVERGYRETSTPEICRRAGLSRGAIAHHFPTKESLVASAVEHVLSKRLREVEARLVRARSHALDLDKAVTFLWSVYTTPSFYAWMELLMAARTDDALRPIVAEVDARFTQRAETLCAFLLPGAKPAELAATTRLVLAIFDGLAMHRIVAKDTSVARHALRIAALHELFMPSKRAKG
jgi:AcrR family transcriptional regulator